MSYLGANQNIEHPTSDTERVNSQPASEPRRKIAWPWGTRYGLEVQFRCFQWCGIVATLWGASCEIRGALRQEFFDATPTNWEGVNNRNEHFPVRTVIQDFGYSPAGT